MTLDPALVPGLDAVPTWIPLVASLLAVLFVHRSVTVVDAHEKCVFVDGGAVSDTLEPGVHVTSPLRSPDHRVDMRTQTFELPVDPQDDGDTALEIRGELRVTNPETVATECPDYQYEVMKHLDERLDSTLERRTWDEIFADASEVERSLERTLRERLDEWGIELKEFSIEGISPGGR